MRKFVCIVLLVLCFVSCSNSNSPEETILQIIKSMKEVDIEKVNSLCIADDGFSLPMPKTGDEVERNEAFYERLSCEILSSDIVEDVATLKINIKNISVLSIVESLDDGINNKDLIDKIKNPKNPIIETKIDLKLKKVDGKWLVDEGEQTIMFLAAIIGEDLLGLSDINEVE